MPRSGMPSLANKIKRLTKLDVGWEEQFQFAALHSINWLKYIAVNEIIVSVFTRCTMPHLSNLFRTCKALSVLWILSKVLSMKVFSWFWNQTASFDKFPSQTAAVTHSVWGFLNDLLTCSSVVCLQNSSKSWSKSVLLWSRKLYCLFFIASTIF